MSKLQSNINELRKIIDKEFDNEEAMEFMDYVEENAEELKKELSDLKIDLEAAENRIGELEEESFSGTDEIDCGIGKIEYNTDNLQLTQLMEALQDRINELGPLKVLRKLQMPLPTT